jgi:hypothetical protein
MTVVVLASWSCKSTMEKEGDSAGAIAAFDSTADLASSEHFFDFPYPSDMRLTGARTPDLRGFPNPSQNAVIDGMLVPARERPGFPAMPVAWFRFSAPLAERAPTDVIAAAKESVILLVDVDPMSKDRGRLVPTIAQTLASDEYVPDNVLAVAARPGFVLVGGRRYAIVVKKSLGDLSGHPLRVPAELATLRDGETPNGPRGTELHDLYAPLFETLDMIGVDRRDVAAATVFTVGDVVADSARMSEGIRKKHTATIKELAVAPDGAPSDDRLCKLVGKVEVPQFQKGSPPYDKEGNFVFGADGLPTMLRTEIAPIVLSLPNGTMPVGGYPLEIYIHGSGGVSSETLDDGPTEKAGGMPEKGHGPAWEVARFGIAVAASAMPVNKERYANAGHYGYLNFNNLGAFPYTFRQGLFEQRMFIDALERLQIDKPQLAKCGAAHELPPGETSFHFDTRKLIVQGESMGGMYTNIIGAVDPRVKIVVPTGAGGYWSSMVLTTHAVEGAAGLLGLLLQTTAQLSLLHPALHLFETAVESAEPIVYMPRVAQRPLPGHPARPIYEPVGKGDLFFSEDIYDAAALAYGNQQAGASMWPGMQTALALDGRAGIVPYPIVNNRMSENGQRYTGVVVQYVGDGIVDPHEIERQLPAVKFQYTCFLDSFLRKGIAIVPAPGTLGSACPE